MNQGLTKDFSSLMEQGRKTGLKVKLWGEGTRTVSVSGIEHDSRKVKKGDLFYALEGENFDGHDFIDQALRRGASAVVGQRARGELPLGDEIEFPYAQVEEGRRGLSLFSHLFYRRPTERLFTVGVTGTNGKTTTVDLVGKVLAEKETGTLTTVGNPERVGEKKPVTTPEAPRIHRFAHRMLEEGKRNFVMEATSHGLAERRVEHVDFDCAVFTNLTRDHLDYHGDMESYGRAKLHLFELLPSSGWAVLNADDPFSARIREGSEAGTITYGLSSKADVRGRKVRQTDSGLLFSVEVGGETWQITTALRGKFNVYNCLAAFALGLARSLPPEEIVSRLSGAAPLSGRMEKFEVPGGPDVFIDFAHNPDALEKTSRELAAEYETIALVFGCGGESDRGKRPLMGAAAERNADYVFLTDDNPKSEDEKRILAEIAQGFSDKNNFETIPDRRAAIERALDRLGAEDCLLIAGKGHERYQVFSDRWVEYSDREFVKKIIAERKG